ncbi:MAG: hypothetical protein ACLFWM_07910 [Actinomycetota bacterium]
MLLGLESIRAVHNSDMGPIAVYVCACDELALWHRSRSYPLPAGCVVSDSETAADLVRAGQGRIRDVRHPSRL